LLGFHKTNSFDIGKMMARTDSEFKQRCEKRTKSKEVNNKRDYLSIRAITQKKEFETYSK